MKSLKKDPLKLFGDKFPVEGVWTDDRESARRQHSSIHWVQNTQNLHFSRHIIMNRNRTSPLIENETVHPFRESGVVEVDTGPT